MDKIIPDFEIEAIARSIYPALRDFYDSPEGQAAFEKWKREQADKPDKKECHSKKRPAP